MKQILAVILPIVGIAAFFYFAGQDIVQSTVSIFPPLSKLLMCLVPEIGLDCTKVIPVMLRYFVSFSFYPFCNISIQVISQKKKKNS
jgi:hypothetical protein